MASVKASKPCPFNSNCNFFFIEYCNDIKDIGILLIIITTAILAALLFSCVTTLTTSVALCRARSIAVSEISVSPFPFTLPYHLKFFKIPNFSLLAKYIV